MLYFTNIKNLKIQTNNYNIFTVKNDVIQLTKCNLAFVILNVKGNDIGENVT